jgi:hypothetical protein
VDEDIRNFFRFYITATNLLLLCSLIFSRVTIVVKSMSNYCLVESLLDDFDSERIMLIENVHVCTEYVHVLNKFFLRSDYANDQCVGPTFTLLFFSVLLQIIVHAFSDGKANWYEYIQIIYPLILHLLAARLLVITKRKTFQAHNKYVLYMRQIRDRHMALADEDFLKAI